MEKRTDEMEQILKKILEMDEDGLESFLKMLKKREDWYLVCMDMGCGGTSADSYKIHGGIRKMVAWPNIHRDKKTGRYLELGISNFIPTILGYDNIGRPVIGPRAFEYGRAAENFKVLPTRENLNCPVLELADDQNKRYQKSLREVWSTYFGEILEIIIQSENQRGCLDCGKDNILFVVAHPASPDWEEEDDPFDIVEKLNDAKEWIQNGAGLALDKILEILEAYEAFIQRKPGMGGTKLLAEAASYKEQIRQGKGLEEAQILAVLDSYQHGIQQWTNLDNFKEMIQEGTGLKREQILTISEAKAAMQYVRRLKNVALDFEKGVIIIDLGASTIDMERISKKKPEPEEYSITLAGKEVDHILAYHILRHSFPEIQERIPTLADYQRWKENDFFEHTVGMSRTEFMYLVRLAKEDACEGAEVEFLKLNGIQWKIASSNSEEMPEARELKVMAPEGGVQERVVVIEELLEQTEIRYECRITGLAQTYKEDAKSFQSVKGSWYGHLEQFVSYAMDRFEADGEAADIVVTGGTSRLVGVERHIRAGINASKAAGRDIRVTMLSSQEDYEMAVPRGASYYVGDVLAHLDDMETFPQALREALDQEIAKGCATYITKHVAAPVNAAIQKSLDQWASFLLKTEECSIEGLERILQTELGNISRDTLKLSVEAGIQDFVTNQKQELPRTYREMDGFLKKISDEKYKRPMDLGNVKMILDHQAIQICTQNTMQKLKCDLLQDTLGKISGLLTRIWTFIKDIAKGGDMTDYERIQWGLIYRRNVRNNFKASDQNNISKELYGMVFRELQDTYHAENRFGLEERIIQSLSDDINRALYLS